MKKIKQYKNLIFHFILWPIAFLILIFVFTKGQIPVKIDYYYTLVFVIFVAIPAVVNFHIFIPFLLKKEKYTFYFIALACLGLSFGVFIKNFFVEVIDVIFPNYFFISYISGDDFYLVFSIFLISSTLLKLAQDWIYFNRNQNEILKLKTLHVESQLSALRSQINPHFLFNALNVVYSMALDKKENITTAIVELSDILRYVIYDTNTDRVRLKDEIELIKNYINFQKHRLNTKIDLQIEVENENFKIYPMLILPLVENAYKFGSSGDEAHPISIKIIQNRNYFEFFIKNKKINLPIFDKDKKSGIGLETLKNNLAIVYKNRHKFEIKETETHFLVKLLITDE
jgi:sensor histidine kinase YesM